MSRHRLQVDWPVCQARGICHELLPEVIDLDPWGFPIIGSEIPGELVRAAKDAVNACPRNALRLRAD